LRRQFDPPQEQLQHVKRKEIGRYGQAFGVSYLNQQQVAMEEAIRRVEKEQVRRPGCRSRQNGRCRYPLSCNMKSTHRRRIVSHIATTRFSSSSERREAALITAHSVQTLRVHAPAQWVRFKPTQTDRRSSKQRRDSVDLVGRRSY